MKRAERFLVILWLGVFLIFSFLSLQAGADELPLSCDSLMVPKKSVNGKMVGQEKCQITSDKEIRNIKGQAYRRLEIGISGTVEGFAVNKKPRDEMITDVPEFAMAQRGNPGPYLHGIGRYEAAKGNGITLFYPESPQSWNGKLYVVLHGSGTYTPVGELVERSSSRGFNPLTGTNSYVGLMIDKGYAVAYLRTSAGRTSGDSPIELDDGTILENKSFGYHLGITLDAVRFAKNFLMKQFGRMPSRTYLYGKSRGASVARLINYTGRNQNDDGTPIIDGLLVDDAGGGYYLPVLFVNGSDLLFAKKEERQRFVKQLDIVHLLYLGETTEDYLQNKRENTRLVLAKGLGGNYRHYEIRGVSHHDAGYVSRMDPTLIPQTLDLGGLFDSFIDMLDKWVDKGIAPPPTKSDALALGDGNKDGINENPAIALPEIACPLGAYYYMPEKLGRTRNGTFATGFAPYDGKGLEPLDGRGLLVDMNGDGIRDRRETLEQAWVRLKLLKPAEKLTHSKYVTCVRSASAKLVKQGFLPAKTGEYYNKAAAASQVGKRVDRRRTHE